MIICLVPRLVKLMLLFGILFSACSNPSPSITKTASETPFISISITPPSVSDNEYRTSTPDGTQLFSTVHPEATRSGPIVKSLLLTQQPTATPQTTIDFSVDRTVIVGQECAKLRWSTENVKEVYLSGGEYGSERKGVVGDAEFDACPFPGSTNTYTLHVIVNQNIPPVEKTVTVTNGAPLPPKVRNSAVEGYKAANLIATPDYSPYNLVHHPCD